VTRDLVPGASRRHVAVDGMRFAVWRSEPETRSSGRPARAPVMLLHGVPQTAAMWRGLVAELRTDRVVLAPDLPGLGSSELRGPYDVRTVSARLAALALHEVDGPLDVVGHDWGGTVALALASSRPDLVRRLVVLNAAYRWLDLRAAWHVPTASLPGLPEMAFRLGGANLVRRVIDYGWRSERPLADDLLSDYQAAYAAPARISAMLGYYRHNFRSRVTAELGLAARRALPSRASTGAGRRRTAPVPTPALVVWGARDPVLPDAVRKSVVRDLGNCRCVVAPEAGHFVLEEAPEVAIPAIASFLEDEDREVIRS
jgi:pimeloyl-ACP methyl ester carboxylesterase